MRNRHNTGPWSCVKLTDGEAPWVPALVVAGLVFAGAYMAQQGLNTFFAWPHARTLMVSVGFGAATVVVSVVSWSIVASIRSGLHGARMASVLDQLHDEDQEAAAEVEVEPSERDQLEAAKARAAELEDQLAAVLQDREAAEVVALRGRYETGGEAA